MVSPQCRIQRRYSIRLCEGFRPLLLRQYSSGKSRSAYLYFTPGPEANGFPLTRHTHQDQLQIFYDYLPSSVIPTHDSSNPDVQDKFLRDTTQIDITRPLQISYIGPSITPLTGL